MNRRLIFLNLALLALAGALGWILRQHFLEARAHELRIFQQAAQKKAMLPPPPVLLPAPVTPVQYIDVAQKMLFSRDRNPNVIEDVKPAPPEPPMPALPSYFGQISIGDPVVFLSLGNSGQKLYHKGDKVGDFEIDSFDRDKIAFLWRGKTVEKKLSELVAKDQQAQQPVAAAAPAARPAAQIKSLGGAEPTDKPDSPDPKIGVDMGANMRGCVTGENSPNGTVINGYKKVIARTLMGQSCHWEPAK